MTARRPCPSAPGPLKQDPAFHTKPQLALALVGQAQAVGIPFRAIVADCVYGNNGALEAALRQRRRPTWPIRLTMPLRAWHRVVRRFRDGHTERWWGELTLLHYGSRQAGARGVHDDRPPCLARIDHLVLDDQTAGRAGLQTNEG